ncbi:MAG: hypothetical protein LBG62_02205 [Candidatus Methanoplasma sp.]|nr:hypothetical protein [Candidatus Methanoplasma sp.]
MDKFCRSCGMGLDGNGKCWSCGLKANAPAPAPAPRFVPPPPTVCASIRPAWLV